MEKISLSVIRSFIFFGRNLVGVLNAPYSTYRKLSQDKADVGQTFFIPILVILYFIFVATLRTSIKTPFLLTAKFNTLTLSFIAGFLGLTGIFYILGKMVGGRGTFRQIYMLWIFSLVPTLIWFFVTSVLYLILPPPRTESLLGKLYSVVFITFSLAVLFWKVILYYLTLRFSLKLDLWRILQISAFVVPVISVYSLLMYRMGIFRIPFL